MVSLTNICDSYKRYKNKWSSEQQPVPFQSSRLYCRGNQAHVPSEPETYVTDTEEIHSCSVRSSFLFSFELPPNRSNDKKSELSVTK
jgi:hypothetical protein